MKPLYLAFEGLHSYREEAEVDFEKLGERGLFGIFGPTGAGKSTILDALTLALYGEVERVQGGKRAGIAHPEADEIRVLLRFEAGAGARYEVRRTFRAKDGLVEAKAARLDRLEGAAAVPVADKVKSVDDAVARAVGLGSENFRRVVVLPQGKFADFLQLTGSKRRAMLEAILGLERFGEDLFRKVADRRRAAQSRLDQLAGQLEALRHATREAVEKARADRDARKVTVHEADAALDALAARLAEARAVSALQAEVRRLQGRQDELVSKTCAVEERRAELDAACRAEPLRGLLEDVQRLAGQKASAQSRRDAAEAKEKDWAKDLASAQAAFEAAARALEEGRPRLSARRDELKQAEKLEEELSARLSELAAAAEARAKATEALERLEADRHQLEGVLSAADREIARLADGVARTQVDPAARERVQAAFQALAQWRQAQEQVRSCEGKRAKKQERAAQARQKAQSASREAAEAEGTVRKRQDEEKAHAQARPGDEKGLREAVKAASALDGLVEAVAAAEEEAQGARDSESAQAAKVARLEGDQKVAAEAHRKAQEKADSAQAELEELVRKSAAGRLAHVLEDGKPCPVCGATEHPSPAARAGDEDLAKAQKAAEAARKVAEKAHRRLAEVEAELGSARQARKGLEDRRKDAAKAAKLRRAKLPEARQAEAVPALRAWRAAESLALSQAEDALDRWRTRAEALARASSEAQEASSRAASTALSAATDAAAEERAVGEASSELEEVRKVVEARRTVLDEKRGDLAVEAIELEQEALARREREAAALAKAQEEADQRRRGSEQALRARLEDAGRLGAELEALGRKAKELSLQQGRLHDQLQTTTGGQGAAALLEACEAALARLERSLASAREAQERNQGGHHRAKEALAAEKARLDAVADQAKKAEARLHAELAAQRFADALAAQEGLRSRERRDALAEAVKAHEDALKENAGALGGARERLAGRSVPEAELSELEQRHARAEAWARQVREELGKLDGLYSKLVGERAKREETEARQATLEPERDRLATLCDLVEGRKLVEFMAEQEIETIARMASHRLRTLTHGRYALVPQQDEKRSSAGFAVRDDHHGGVERPVGSLSGGETFLASLAMALALSMQVQLRGEQLKFFFLDEGFGTLDPATLDVAMGALERLQAEDLTVGVITHVDEVRARMPRRLVVTPAVPGGPGSRVSIEEA